MLQELTLALSLRLLTRGDGAQWLKGAAANVVAVALVVASSLVDICLSS